MGITHQLKNYAADFAEAAQQRIAELDRKLAALKVERMQVQAQRDVASGAFQRLTNYPVQVGADYACPGCWINRNTISPLRPIPSETHNDLFRCDVCHLDLELEP